MNQSDSTIFDTQATLRYVGNDLKLLRDLLDVFDDYGPTIMARMRTAIDAKDTCELREAAHSLKGALATFHPTHALATAQELESCTVIEPSTRTVYSKLEAQVDELLSAVTSILIEP